MSRPATARIATAGASRAAEADRRTPCPACGGAASADIGPVEVEEQHLCYTGGNADTAALLGAAFPQGPGTYRMLRCAACALEYADPLVAPPSEWYGELYAAHDLYPSERWEYGVVRRALRPTDVLVDYGCGSGGFLRSLRPHVARAVGVDFSGVAVRQAQSEGVTVHRIEPGDAFDRRMLPSAARHITAFHVIEHLSSPASLFAFADGVGAADASLWVAVPSDRRASRTHGEPDAFDAPPHHLTRWTELALCRVGHAHGWRLDALSREPLTTRLAVWEAARRLPIYRAFNPAWRPLEWAGRRAIAAGAWAAGVHRRAASSGFSMLARYSRQGR